MLALLKCSCAVGLQEALDRHKAAHASSSQRKASPVHLLLQPLPDTGCKGQLEADSTSAVRTESDEHHNTADRAITSSPLDRAVTSSPSDRTITSSPNDIALAISPTGRVVTGSPIDRAVASSPSDRAVASSPIDRAVTSSPSARDVTTSPVAVSGKPALPQPDAAQISSEGDASSPKAAIQSDLTRLHMHDANSIAEAVDEAEEEGADSPGSFAAAQLKLMQQRQQQLQAQRLAKMQRTVLAPIPAIQQRQFALQQQSSAQDASRGGSPVQTAAQQAQHAQQSQHGQQAHADSEPVANSPVVLFSPGGPYSCKSSWYSSPALTQVRAC